MLENARRLDRDVFFSKAINGSNRQAVHDASAKLLPRLGSQDDSLYLLGQMREEIGKSHTFMRRGVGSDTQTPSATGLLGADYDLTGLQAARGFAAIYMGDQTRPEYAGPLGQPGVNVKQGDYLLAIDGRD